jgi:DNA-binding transcriptional regulator YiaG
MLSQVFQPFAQDERGRDHRRGGLDLGLALVKGLVELHGGEVTAREAKLRFRAGGFATLRKRLGLSAEAMGKLLGVSGQSVYHWESGKASPRSSQLPAIAAVRKLGKREAQARLSKIN